MREHLSPKQLGQAIGASEASVKRWVDQGKIDAYRTGGGHRRLPLSGVMEFLRKNQISLVRPEVLGLPPSTGQGERQLAKIKNHLAEALEAGDEERARSLGFNLYLAGQSCVDICDLFLAAVFHELGERWQHGALEVYQERRACEICLRLLHALRMSIPQPAEGALRAVGATLSHDHYTLPNAMVELVLRESGWRAETLGTGLPADTIISALEQEQPRLFWLSVSHLESESDFLRTYESIYQAADENGVAIVVGGRALHEELRKQMNYSAHCDQLRHLVAFASTLNPPQRT